MTQPSQMRKGAVELAVTALLRTRERYAGELLADLAALPGLDVGAGTLYPLLARLAKAGHVSSHWKESPSGPPRKYYTLTHAGHAALEKNIAQWRTITASMTTLLEDHP